VLSISSILVLAGFAANEKAYAGSPSPQDELHCYELGLVNGPSLPTFEMILVDQFQEAAHVLLGVEEICNPVDKETNLFENIFNQTNQHWTAYTINSTLPQNAEVIATVSIVDQFHDPEPLIVDVLDVTEFLMVPADKFHNTNEFLSNTDIHYKCYDLANTDPIQDTITLTDQFEQFIYEDVTIFPVEICVPVQKFIEDEPGSGNFNQVSGDNSIPEHYLCYDFAEEDENPSVSGSFSFTDQFLTDADATILNDGVLCTLATKTIIGPVVGGINIPIDTSALLLAGVQSISMWMIPVVIAGVGIGIFVIKRRK